MINNEGISIQIQFEIPTYLVRSKGGVDRGYEFSVQYIINGERVFVHLQNKE